MPKKYSRPLVPCTSCRSVLTDDDNRAVIVRHVSAGLAYFECRVCGHGGAGHPPFKLPIER